jgi:hypothetical protein
MSLIARVHTSGLSPGDSNDIVKVTDELNNIIGLGVNNIYDRQGSASAYAGARDISLVENATQIDTNTTAISNNTADIATNTGNIATNASDIANLQQNVLTRSDSSSTWQPTFADLDGYYAVYEINGFTGPATIQLPDPGPTDPQREIVILSSRGDPYPITIDASNTSLEHDTIIRNRWGGLGFIRMMSIPSGVWKVIDGNFNDIALVDHGAMTGAVSLGWDDISANDVINLTGQSTSVQITLPTPTSVDEGAQIAFVSDERSAGAHVSITPVASSLSDQTVGAEALFSTTLAGYVKYMVLYNQSNYYWYPVQDNRFTP